MRTASWVASLGITGLLIGCSSGTLFDFDGAGSAGTSGPAQGAITEQGNGSVPRCTAGSDVGKSYVGFGGRHLEADREDMALGFDRSRTKPFAVLVSSAEGRGEFERVLGSVPSSLQAVASNFAETPANYYVEPRMSGVGIHSLFEASFDGCLAFTAADPKYDIAPTPDTAKAECAALARRFWSRTASPEEVGACVAVVTEDAASEPLPERQWAYVCAALLTTTAFLTF